MSVIGQFVARKLEIGNMQLIANCTLLITNINHYLPRQGEPGRDNELMII